MPVLATSVLSLSRRLTPRSLHDRCPSFVGHSNLRSRIALSRFWSRLASYLAMDTLSKPAAPRFLRTATKALRMSSEVILPVNEWNLNLSSSNAISLHSSSRPEKTTVTWRVSLA